MNVIAHPPQFKEGVRILMLTLRGKDGGKNTKGDRVAKKVITHNAEEFEEAFQRLQALATEGERIYATVERRDWDKGIHLFKHRQLDADLQDDGSRFGFYRDAFNRVVSSLQNPTSRAETLFLWDCDSTEEYQHTLTLLQGFETRHDNRGRVDIVHSYLTKNGGHIITKPFDYTKLPPELHPLRQKNAMMLWAY